MRRSGVGTSRPFPAHFGHGRSGRTRRASVAPVRPSRRRRRHRVAAAGRLARELDGRVGDLRFRIGCRGARCVRSRRGSDCASRSPFRRTRPAGSSRSRWCTPLMDSTKRRQSTDDRNRRLPIELPSVTWSAAWAWLPACTICSIVEPSSARRCSIQPRARSSDGFWPCRSRTNSDTNDADIGGFERAMSAITRIRFLGSCSTVVIMRRGPLVREVAVAATGRNAQCHAAQVFDQRQPQHDRDRPQLAQVQRRHALVRGQETAQAVEVDASVAVRNRFQRNVVDAREARRGDPRRGVATPGCSSAASGASPCGSAPRSGRSCRAAIRWPASHDDRT